jgi:hypothetical protein
LGVGVERDDVLDVGQDVGFADNRGKASGRTGAQERIELRELPALAFVPHPDAFPGIPATGSMKQKKKILPLGGILLVQHLHPGARPLEQRFILGQHLGRGVAVIRQEGEVQVLIAT